MSKQSKKSLKKLTDVLSWTSTASNERKYLAPTTRWQKFLYLMSYGQGTLVEATDRIVPTVIVSEEKITYTNQSFVSIPTHVTIMPANGSSTVVSGSVLR